MMDTVVVKLEGGTDADVKALESERIEDDSLIEIKREQEKEKEKETSKDEESTEKEDKTESESQDANGADKQNGTEAAEKTNQEDGALSDGDDSTKKKMLLHKTSSIFLRNVPPSVTQEELEGLCKRSPGFLRLCFSEPFHDRKWHRRAWATYRRDVNIREICWTINNIKIRDSELNGIINRDITRRVRTANGVTGHISVAQNDLKQAAKLVALLDKQIGMFTTESEEERMKDIQLGVDLVESSKNPILRSVRDVYLDAMLDDVSPEEEEMLGIQKSSSYAGSGGEAPKVDEKVPFNRDERIIKALDKLIFYLRIVHSVDYYFHGEYPNEDKMSNRCGMFHVRAPTPTAALPPFTATDDGKLMMPKKFVTDFITNFSQRLSAEFFSIEFISQDDLEKLGKNDPEEALEKFIQENTVELAKDKWLCPLSGKKFKGPEFIRKHLETKHQDRLDEAKVDALFYNNYLIDARRPMEPEGKQLQTATPQRDRERGEDDRRDRERERGGDRFDDRRRDGGSLFGSGGGDRNRAFPNRYDRGDHGRPNQGGGRYFDDGARGRRDPRVPIAYRDLDAPEDIA
ncbi:hypothetical protein WR25_14424 [Diploscapter pachys]|uniref:SERRATE/Ars2 C-terminal domain-containing protein n=1 Tax=Diploscapter pachys TaxID=2018661 RepID=A0A2A2JFY2_9BILA|nr:hypothetical protein WR25_14424 [Diploscapter pachys]